MEKNEIKHPKILYAVLLAAGFLGMFLPGVLDLSLGAGIASAVWIFAFLYLIGEFRTRRQLLVSAAVFCAAYLMRFFTAIGSVWVYSILFFATALAMCCIFQIYSYLIHRWNHVAMTLAFPAIWMAVYLLATLLGIPTLIRVDSLFVGMRVLIQSESVIGAYGLSFAILWILALVHYSVRNRQAVTGAVCVGMYFVLLLIGVLQMVPNVTRESTVPVAYATGPYGGDYITYKGFSLEENLASAERSIREAGDRGAAIMVFNEEAFEIDDTEEETFLTRCCELAGENRIHVLVGLDISDTDGSENGKSLNKIVWIDSDGEILDAYLKTKLIPVLEAGYKRGDGHIPSHIISAGGELLKVSYLICYDSNFPEYVRNIEDDTDILFLPSWDWEGVTELHGRLCCAIAEENQVNILKCTYDGISMAIDPDGQIIASSDTDDDGYEKVHLVNIPVSRETQKTGGVSGNAPIFAIVAVELMSLCICVILLFSNIFTKRKDTSRNRLFSILVIVCMLALLADAVSWLVDGCTRLEPILYSSTILSMILPFVLTGIFVVYLTEYIRERKPISSVFSRIYMGYALAAILFTFIVSLTGDLFSFSNGVYSDGHLYGVYLVANVCSMCFCLAIIIACRKQLRTEEFVACCFYVFIPSASAVINIFAPNFSYAFPATTLSLIIVYVMIQSDLVAQLERDEQRSAHSATHDQLTGLLNRRAYDEKLRALSETETAVGVMFADVNGLKFTNDNLGHEAGDRLLLYFAEMLRSNFREEEVFRISGDEFVVILPETTQEALDRSLEKLEKDILIDETAIACVGAEFGTSSDLVKMVKAAEFRMYSKKMEFYQIHPELRRV